MKRLRVYVDTSVIGGCLDDEFWEESQKLLDRARAGEVVLVVSEVTELELVTAPAEVRTILENLPREAVERVELTEEARALAGHSIAAGVISPKMLARAPHRSGDGSAGGCACQLELQAYRQPEAGTWV